MTKWKIERVGTLPEKARSLTSCTVMKKRIYLCFWSDGLFGRATYKKCMTATGPIKQFTLLESESIYNHGSTTIASNNRKALLLVYFNLATVNILAVGHLGKGWDESHTKAELLTPDSKWTVIGDCPYGTVFNV